MAGTKTKKNLSELSCINCQSDNPFDLFKEWWDIVHSSDIAKQIILPSKVCFSTASQNGRVSSRYLILQEYDDWERNGFVVMSDARSKKFENLNENPQAAMVFMWTYVENNKKYLRQIRVEGEVEKLTKDFVQPLYDSQRPLCKIRAHLCHQDQEVNWDDLKAKHDELMKRVESGEELPMPDHFVGIKLQPRVMEFYFSAINTIADRLYFEKTNDKWEKKRIAA